jgi:atlastin
MAACLNYEKSLQILKFEDGKVLVDLDPLKSLLHHPEVKNRKIVAFSIVGAYRKGKSFFLGYCLRYLYANVSEIY